jgi:hypothetical protein
MHSMHFLQQCLQLTLNTMERLMKITVLKGILLAASITTLNSHAAPTQSGLEYTYAGIQYFSQQLDQYDCNQDGISLNGSLDLNGHWYALGTYSDASGNKHCGSETISAGAGYRTLFKDKIDIYGNVSFEDTSADYGDGDSGIILAGGLRGFIAQQLEGKIEIAHHTAFDGTTLINGGVAYWFEKQFAVTGDISLGADGTAFAIGARMNF